ncbi:uncharacterized protein I303_105866 [Kwoniella dejecticola CBS 10117]|uniref:Calpain catalytic domain-containing protein n=1 Tax=Kwoniella dejecticola CBS 10117 TaxID=1296121 RepID=A0A1A6A0L0_9TREE|nr:uncharacterized protein I303_05887 [Kwoniella dejecticola CBS 10117]OBR83607.1 hypothetical protein I303_05887 [Kwoniella dejecticola CBS 10117]
MLSVHINKICLAIVGLLVLASGVLGVDLEPREGSKASPLCDSHGMGASIFRHNKHGWDSTWFGSSAAAFANANSAYLEKRYQVTGQSINGDCKNPTDKIKVNLVQADGKEVEKEVEYSKVSSDADWTSASWLLSGFETAAIDMGGYMGLDGSSMSFGDPTDAFYMLSGKKAVMDYWTDEKKDDENKKKELFNLLKKAKTEPILIGAGAGPDTLNAWNWYAVMNVDTQDDKDMITYWHPDSTVDAHQPFDDIFSDLRRVVRLVEPLD